MHITKVQLVNRFQNFVPGAEGLVVRIVSSVEKKLEVKPWFLEIFQEENYPLEFPYKSKACPVFQSPQSIAIFWRTNT
ncbi:PREDICTED: probable histone acetyltransferase HAC-like 1 [Nicotiana attenuata]|uniref:probable histone acetyltransferase HAC-like 1 n=1 Tax=Nicotiana attenuata TaxID=49451 RepID=UPI0009051CB1|nr:PREDICTED: probable histone acetyltransferase HAC-like 1 [Nicotiana attenuata]